MNIQTSFHTLGLIIQVMAHKLEDCSDSLMWCDMEHLHFENGLTAPYRGHTNISTDMCVLG